MTAPHHNASTAKLPPDLHLEARRMVAARGLGKTTLALRTTEPTLAKLLDGPGLTVRARDRIEARLREVTATAAVSVQAASFESADGTTRGFMMHATVEATGEGAGALLGSVLGLAAGFAR